MISMAKEYFWSKVAGVLSNRHVVDWILRRDFPHYSSVVKDGVLYMDRWWVFNPVVGGKAKYKWLPSIRINAIKKPDMDDAPHDHPWDARSIILRGGYIEERTSLTGEVTHHGRGPGESYLIRHGEFHRIMRVPFDTVWTIFITYRYRGQWGFLSDGKKIPWRKYLGLE